MNTTSIIATAAFAMLASSAALAEGATFRLPQPVHSQTTRAAVLAEAEMQRERSQALTSEAGIGSPGAAMLPHMSIVSREAVRAEARTARRLGIADALDADDNSFAGAAASLTTGG